MLSTSWPVRVWQEFLANAVILSAAKNLVPLERRKILRYAQNDGDRQETLPGSWYRGHSIAPPIWVAMRRLRAVSPQTAKHGLELR
jgi:hypothetical protein